MAENTTQARAAKDMSKSRMSRSVADGNKNVNAVRTSEPMGNATLGVTEKAVRKNLHGPFLGTNKPS